MRTYRTFWDWGKLGFKVKDEELAKASIFDGPKLYERKQTVKVDKPNNKGKY